MTSPGFEQQTSIYLLKFAETALLKHRNGGICIGQNPGFLSQDLTWIAVRPPTPLTLPYLYKYDLPTDECDT